MSKASLLLPREENLLAVFKWKLGQIPSTNAWHPVLAQYVDQLIARVNAFGGNGLAIPPSLKGYPGKGQGGHPHHEELHEHTGKVTGLVYDRFGDFENFHFRTEAGHALTFESHEIEIERLVKYAWERRVVVSVFAHRYAPHVPVTIVLRRFPLIET